MTTTNLTDCTVYLDAGFDLYQAGRPNDFAAQEDFESAYRQAANTLGVALGVQIGIAAPPCSEYGGIPGGHIESEEWARDCEVWQGLHNCLYHNGEEWLYDEGKIESLAREIKRQMNK